MIVDLYAYIIKFLDVKSIEVDRSQRLRMFWMYIRNQKWIFVDNIEYFEIRLEK